MGNTSAKNTLGLRRDARSQPQGQACPSSTYPGWGAVGVPLWGAHAHTHRCPHIHTHALDLRMMSFINVMWQPGMERALGENGYMYMFG